MPQAFSPPSWLSTRQSSIITNGIHDPVNLPPKNFLCRLQFIQEYDTNVYKCSLTCTSSHASSTEECYMNGLQSFVLTELEKVVHNHTFCNYILDFVILSLIISLMIIAKILSKHNLTYLVRPCCGTGTGVLQYYCMTAYVNTQEMQHE